MDTLYDERTILSKVCCKNLTLTTVYHTGLPAALALGNALGGGSGWLGLLYPASR